MCFCVGQGERGWVLLVADFAPHCSLARFARAASALSLCAIHPTHGYVTSAATLPRRRLLLQEAQ